MNEVSLIDQSVLELLQAGRLAAEQETSDRAALFHETAQRDGHSITVGRLLLNECINLRNNNVKREEHYLKANWFSRRLMDRRAEDAFFINATVNGKRVEIPAKHELRVRNRMLKYCRDFQSGSLFPQEAEHSGQVQISQDWFVVSKQYYLFETFHRAIELNSGQTKITPIHNIYPTDNGMSVREHNNTEKGKRNLDESEFYFPLGLILEANKQLNSSVPARVSKKW